jgi:hypothetical protein
VSNSVPRGVLSMSQVTDSLFNEETRRKSAAIDNAQALVARNKGRSKSREHKGNGKSIKGNLVTKATVFIMIKGEI